MWSYIVTTLMVLTTNMIRSSVLGDGYPFLVYDVLILLAALLFDKGAGFFCMLLGALSFAFHWYGFSIPSVKDTIPLLPLILYMIGGSIISLITQTLVHFSERLVANVDKLTENESRNTLMVRDLHHRVKNHLQSVASLINMSKKKVRDPAAIRELDTTANRLYVLARVYDRLQFDHDDLEANVCVQDFISQLCHDLTVGVIDGRPIMIHQNVEQHVVPVSTCVALGLLVNELVSNSLKHAFPDDREGNVFVDFTYSGGSFTLRVADDGIGYDLQTVSRSVGSRLIESLAHQLDGHLTRGLAHGDRGAVTTLIFREQT